MRPWMNAIVHNSAAYNDFYDFTRKAVEALNIVLAKAVRDDEMEKARGIAHEIKVYKDLEKSITREVQEHNAQLTYNSQVKGG